jgi:DNA (cytosine-5)-methyltransferase 1
LLVFEFLRLVNEIKPKVWIFENVSSLFSHDKGKTWQIIESEIKKLGYSYHFKVLNAKDYGIPQNRKRMFIVGFLDKREFEFPAPEKLKLALQDLLELQVDKKYFLSEKGAIFVANPMRLKKRYNQIDGNLALCQRANQQFNLQGDFVHDYLNDSTLFSSILSNNSNLDKLEVCKQVCGAKRLRKLTPRECLRLMGYCDEFKIVVSDTQAYRQSGNSIVVNIIIIITT